MDVVILVSIIIELAELIIDTCNLQLFSCENLEKIFPRKNNWKLNAPIIPAHLKFWLDMSSKNGVLFNIKLKNQVTIKLFLLLNN